MNPADPAASRKRVYALLVTVAVAMVAGRIVSAELVFEPSLYHDADKGDDLRRPRKWPKTTPPAMPTFSSNDRSRWATIRNLVHEGTYAVGKRAVDPATKTYKDTGIIFDPRYGTVDKVFDQKTNTFYSSKPPLLTTILAGEYWILYHLGWSLDNDEDVWFIVSVILFTFYWLPLLVYLVLLARLLEEFGTTDWGRFFVLTAAAFATLVTLFAISVNNHSIAACTALFAFYPAVRIRSGEKPGVVPFLVSGFFAGLTASFELPAAALLVALFLLLLVRRPWRTLAFFLPAAAIPVAAFLWTNDLAVGQYRPVQSDFESPWYKYKGSHWTKPASGEIRHGIDYAWQHESRGEYAFNYFLGHHGLFTMSPIYLLTVAGIVFGLLRGRRRTAAPPQPDGEVRAGPPFFLYGLTLFLSAAVVGFYLVKTNNYGGWTNGLRWLMWLTPFWLLTMLPVADRLAGCRWRRGLAYFLLAVSVFSVNYRSWNPWRHPWLYNLMEWLGWPGY